MEGQDSWGSRSLAIKVAISRLLSCLTSYQKKPLLGVPCLLRVPWTEAVVVQSQVVPRLPAQTPSLPHLVSAIL